MTTTRPVKHFINKIKKISIDNICFFSIIIYSLLLLVYLMGKGDPFILSTSEDPFTFSTSCQSLFKGFLIIAAAAIFIMCFFYIRSLGVFDFCNNFAGDHWIWVLYWDSYC